MKAPIDRAVFYARLRATKLLGPTISDTEFQGLEGLFSAWEQQGWPSDLRHVAYTMATAWHEARLDGGIREGGLGKGHAYGKPVGPYGQVYYGRSFPQITWYENYEKFGRLLNIDLARNPDLALKPEIGAAILIIGSRDGLFRAGKSLARYFNATKDDPVGARDIINGDMNMVVKKQPDPTLTYGKMIAGYHRTILGCLNAAYQADAPVPTPPVNVAPVAPPPAIAPPTQPIPTEPKGFWASMLERLRAAYPRV